MKLEKTEKVMAVWFLLTGIFSTITGVLGVYSFIALASISGSEIFSFLSLIILGASLVPLALGILAVIVSYGLFKQD
ncbi:MAG: hypothetical protein HY831_01140 [Candidatus Aenigmarchaeota archaeon]|nr:hypothetical protein [Candidatus Aenigmarchaeota archaeon]